MSSAAVIMMILICGLVWGGFISCILFVMRREKEKAVRLREKAE